MGNLGLYRFDTEFCLLVGLSSDGFQAIHRYHKILVFLGLGYIINFDNLGQGVVIQEVSIMLTFISTNMSLHMS